MQQVMRGVIHGRTIKLDRDPEIADGSPVEIVVRTKSKLAPPPAWSADSPVTAAGLLAHGWTDEDDRILEEIYRDRKQDGRREPHE